MTKGLILISTKRKSMGLLCLHRNILMENKVEWHFGKGIKIELCKIMGIIWADSAYEAHFAK